VFPISELCCTGMTLRDYFAGQVISEVLNVDSIPHSVEIAYQIADSMLRARGNNIES